MVATPAPSHADAPRPVAFRVLAAQPLAERPAWFSALDVAIECADGAVRIGGLRTAAWFQEPPSAMTVADTDFDPGGVRYWDFGRLLWVGPSAAPRLVWSNAAALSVQSVATLLYHDGGRDFLAGPDGAGLPTATALGLDLTPIGDAAGARIAVTVGW